MTGGMRSGGIGRRVGGLACALALSSAILVSQPAVAHAVDCSRASVLTDAGYPQRAIAYVDGVNVDYTEDVNKLCRTERAEAAANVEDAEKGALEAQRLAAEAKTTKDAEERQSKTDEAEALAGAAHELDRENERANAFLNPATPTRDSWWQTLAAGWEAFTKATLTPLGTLALPAAVLFAALLTAARVLASAVPWRGRSGADQATRRLRWSWLAIAAASAGLVALMSGLWPEVTGTARWVVYAALVTIAGIGAWLAAWGMGRRLRIMVAVRNAGAEDSAKSAHVLALLEQFGASPPKGIERPTGPDVNALENVLSEAGTGWIAMLKSGLATLFGWTPWRVTVDYTKEPDVIVTITRNGHSAGAAVITSAMQKVGDTKIDPAVYAAAFVLVTLAQAHDGFKGLCGATDWRALAMHHQTVGLQRDDARPLLEAALRRDAASWLTRLDHAHNTWRKSVKPEDLNDYAGFLTNSVERLKAEYSGDDRAAATSLLLRTQLTLAVIRINLAFVDDKAAQEDRIARAYAAIAEACHGAAEAQDLLSSGSERWLNGMKAKIAAMASVIPDADLATLLGGSRPATTAMVRGWRTLPFPPSAHYSMACALATPGLREPAPGANVDTEEIVRRLRLANASPSFADWIPTDPQLAWFRTTEAYAKVRPTPGSDLLALKPFAPRRAALTRLGLTSAPLIAATDPDILAAQLGLARPAADVLVGAARLHATLIATPDVKAFAVEAVRHLINADLADIGRIRALDRDGQETLASDLAEASAPFIDLPSDVLKARYLNWIGALPESPTTTVAGALLGLVGA